MLFQAVEEFLIFLMPPFPRNTGPFLPPTEEVSMDEKLLPFSFFPLPTSESLVKNGRFPFLCLAKYLNNFRLPLCDKFSLLRSNQESQKPFGRF